MADGIAGCSRSALIAVGSGFVLAQQPTRAHLRQRQSTGLSGCARSIVLKGGLRRPDPTVMARNGSTPQVQPLAAQAGLRILQQGGKAIDAAVALPRCSIVVFPQNVGIGGDLFALIYVAKEKKVYQLNASGIAPAGLTLDSNAVAWLQGGPGEFRSRFRYAIGWHSHRHGCPVPSGDGRKC
jgi:hypothetical protein